MKKFIIILIIILTACNNNSPSNLNSFTDETVVNNIKDSVIIYNEHKDSLIKFGTGQTETFNLKYNDGSGYNVSNIFSTKQYFIKTFMEGYYYNSNTRKTEIWGKDNNILIFNDKTEMKNVLSKSLSMINNGYAKKVPNDDFVEFPIIGEYELRIERSGGIISYTIYKFGNNKKYETESAWLTKTEMQKYLKLL